LRGLAIRSALAVNPIIRVIWQTSIFTYASSGDKKTENSSAEILKSYVPYTAIGRGIECANPRERRFIAELLISIDRYL